MCHIEIERRSWYAVMLSASIISKHRSASQHWQQSGEHASILKACGERGSEHKVNELNFNVLLLLITQGC